jgi:hypothetical protein
MGLEGDSVYEMFLCYFLEYRARLKSKNPVILNVTHHCQKPENKQKVFIQ